MGIDMLDIVNAVRLQFVCCSEAGRHIARRFISLVQAVLTQQKKSGISAAGTAREIAPTFESNMKRKWSGREDSNLRLLRPEREN